MNTNNTDNGVCTVCKGSFGIPIDLHDLYYLNRNVKKEDRYVYPEWPLCSYCLEIAEDAYIGGLTKEEMPLNINRGWVFKNSQDYFKKRMKELLGVTV